MTKPIIVGVDGSTSATNAVRWAAREATSRRVPLWLVHSYLQISTDAQAFLPRSVDEALREQGQDYLDTAAAVAREAAPGTAVSTQFVVGAAAQALTALSERACLVVVGSRGLGGFTSLIVGSVAITLAAHGHCPVVAVRGATVDAEPPAAGPVVTGVNGSVADEAVLEFAFDQASRSRTSLVVVHAWNDHIAESVWAKVPFVMLGWAAIERDARLLLAESIAGWQEKYPEVTVQRVVVKGSAPRALLAQAPNARLLVVGSRGRGALRGAVLGSTSQALLHHAPCPVAVVRPTTGS
ncbi:universal stress protein [Allokutzneria oryzae]|uniref:Universal stress protein n=1 Tax=Allokutzneria oryzae TaxID=1378989 RepID=A0ABV5ZWV6_9PSEU